ncbi:DNA-binding protein [Oceanobacillus halophilus]|uniref:DNA-binding protein n=1 Tax=Oceanobacillus halophilus TaxID=930130 RepID=A0A494ZS52_9BACI|nr:DNA-binding protein [Oceanobacillus halophilus]RKQ28680.1 DNA-binding protein [Oceanobacillus halophilus]
MRLDIQPNERAFTTKEVAESLELATATVRRYGQILERNGYEFFKDGDRRIFVRSDIEALIALRDTEKSQDETARDLVEEQKERLKQSTEVAIPDTDEQMLRDPAQLSEFFQALATQLAAAREMNVQLSNDMNELKSKVAQLQQDHHVISSGVGNFAQKTSKNMEKLSEQQKEHYENLLDQEREKNEILKNELQQMREEQRQEWQSQTEFNKRLEESMNQPKGPLGKILALFQK